ncbi:unnamed protein product, partial [Amoebophrya sp. A120]
SRLNVKRFLTFHIYLQHHFFVNFCKIISLNFTLQFIFTFLTRAHDDGFEIWYGIC